MRQLTILYDATCGICTWAKYWMLREPAYVELKFVGAGSEEAQASFPTLAAESEPQELIVIDDEGGIYKDGDAWIMCLYALREYREWSFRLARPAVKPLAKKAFKLLSTNRHTLSGFLHVAIDDSLTQRLQGVPVLSCVKRAERPSTKEVFHESQA